MTLMLKETEASAEARLDFLDGDKSKRKMSFSGQSSFGDRASRGSKANDSGPIDESALKALAQRFDLEIIFRLSISQSE